MNILISVIALLIANSLKAYTAVEEAQADRLGKGLMPLGWLIAKNAAGTIPEWAGGLSAIPSSYRVGMHHPDPFAQDK